MWCVVWVCGGWWVLGVCGAWWQLKCAAYGLIPVTADSALSEVQLPETSGFALSTGNLGDITKDSGNMSNRLLMQARKATQREKVLVTGHGDGCVRLWCTQRWQVKVWWHATEKDDEIRDGLSGNICRCTGYQHIVDAVRAARDERDKP